MLEEGAERDVQGAVGDGPGRAGDGSDAEQYERQYKPGASTFTGGSMGTWWTAQTVTAAGANESAATRTFTVTVEANPLTFGGATVASVRYPLNQAIQP